MNLVFLYVIDGIIIGVFGLTCMYSFYNHHKIIKNNHNHFDNDNALKYSSDYISIQNENIENEIDSLV